MKKIISLMLLACCLLACNSNDKKITDLEKACEANNLEKAVRIYESIDESELTLKQVSRLTEIAMKYSALQTKDILDKSAQMTSDLLDQSTKMAQDIMEQSAKMAQEIVGESIGATTQGAASDEWDKALNDIEQYINQCMSLREKVKAGNEMAGDTFDLFYDKAADLFKRLNDAESSLSASQTIRAVELYGKMSELEDLYYR